MAIEDELADWIIKNQDKRGTEEFNIVAEALEEAISSKKTKGSPVAKGDFSFDVPGGQPSIQEPRREAPSFTAGEYARALPEALGAIATAGTTGILGQGAGFAEQYARELMAGELGSQAAAQRIQQKAAERGQQFAMTPESPAAQQILSGLGQITEPLQALDPVVSSQLMQMSQGARSALQQREGIRQQARLVSSQDVAEEAFRRNISVLGSDVTPPETAVGRMMQRAGERMPVIGTGGLRRTQQQERIDATRQLLEDAGAVEFRNASDKVMKDLLESRRGFITKYVKDKNDVIDNLSKPVFVKAPGQGRFVESARPVEMKNLNAYLQGELENRGLIRQAQNGDKQAAALVNEIVDIQRNFQGSRLFDVEAKRKRLGQRFSDPSLATIKDEGDQIINGAYRAIVDDMGSFIETYGGKEDKLKWKRANRKLKDNIDELKDRGFAKLVREGEANPDQITNAILSQNAPKIKAVYRNLSAQGKKDADRLFLNAAYTASLKNDVVDPDTFNNFIKKHKAAVDSMDPARKAELLGFSRALDFTSRAKQAAVLPDTGAMNQIPVLATMASVIFGNYGAPIAIGGVATGSRYFESPERIRKSFQNLAKTPRGSKAEKLAFDSINAAIIAENNRLAKESAKEQQKQQSLQSVRRIAQ